MSRLSVEDASANLISLFNARNAESASICRASFAFLSLASFSEDFSIAMEV